MKKVLINTMIWMACMSLSILAGAENINGNGMVSTHTYEVASFKSLVVDGQFEVYLSYGLQSSVTVLTDENLQHAVLMDNDGTTLFIRTKEQFGESAKLALYITVNSVDAMDFKDVISVQSTEALWFNNLSLHLNTIGNTRLQLACKTLDAKLEGAGDLHLSGSIEEMRISHKGLGALYTNELQVEKVIMNHKGSRNVEMKMINDRTSEVKMVPLMEGIAPKA